MHISIIQSLPFLLVEYNVNVIYVYVCACVCLSFCLFYVAKYLSRFLATSGQLIEGRCSLPSSISLVLFRVAVGPG